MYVPSISSQALVLFAMEGEFQWPPFVVFPCLNVAVATVHQQSGLVKVAWEIG